VSVLLRALRQRGPARLDANAMDSGIPLVVYNKIVGAEQDGLIAKAGVDVLSK
jgi:hypothetical protein